MHVMTLQGSLIVRWQLQIQSTSELYILTWFQTSMTAVYYRYGEFSLDAVHCLDKYIYAYGI
jgi:hypothetical protein